MSENVDVIRVMRRDAVQAAGARMMANDPESARQLASKESIEAQIAVAELVRAVRRAIYEIAKTLDYTYVPSRHLTLNSVQRELEESLSKIGQA